MRHAAVAPGLRRGPMCRVDDVERVGVTPLPAVGPAELAAVAGRAAEIDLQEGHAGIDYELPERHPVTEGLMPRAAVRVDHARHSGRFLADGTGRQEERAFDAQPVSGLEADPRSGGETAGIDDRRQ